MIAITKETNHASKIISGKAAKYGTLNRFTVKCWKKLKQKFKHPFVKKTTENNSKIPNKPKLIYIYLDAFFFQL